MKLVPKKGNIKHKNSEACTAYEYPLGDKDISGAVIKLKGRYPDKGWVRNEVCKELGYILRGKGKIVTEGKSEEVKEGDLVLLEANEKYYWEGNMEMFMPNTPAFYPEQHKLVD